MDSKFHLYIDSFKRYEPSGVEIHSRFSNLSDYSTFINNKANEIFSEATVDTTIDYPLLRQEINELGKLYVRSFIALSKQK